MTITLLKSEPEHNRQTVQLSLDIETYGHQTTLTVAHMGEKYVNLARLVEVVSRDDNGVPDEREHIALSAEEADMFVEAWTAFKAGIAAKEQARLERIAVQHAEALALVASVKTTVPELDITITPDTGYAGLFVVEVPRFSFYESVYCSEDGDSDLVDAVQRAIARIERFMLDIEYVQGNDGYERYNDQKTRENNAHMVAAWRAVRPLVPVPADKETKQGTEKASAHDFV